MIIEVGKLLQNSATRKAKTNRSLKLSEKEMKYEYFEKFKIKPNEEG